MGKETIEVQGLQITSYPVQHTDDSIGFRIENRLGKVLAYSGDSDICPGLTDLAMDADLAVMECSFPDRKKCVGHLTPSEAGKTAREAGTKRIVLTHFYPECEGVDLLGQCRRFYQGETYLAQDLMEYDI